MIALHPDKSQEEDAYLQERERQEKKNNSHYKRSTHTVCGANVHTVIMYSSITFFSPNRATFTIFNIHYSDLMYVFTYSFFFFVFVAFAFTRPTKIRTVVAVHIFLHQTA